MQLSSKKLSLKYAKQKSFNTNAMNSFLRVQKNGMNEKATNKSISFVNYGNDFYNNSFNRINQNLQMLNCNKTLSLSMKSFKDIEENLKTTIFEMKNTLLIENEDLNNEFQNNSKIKSELDIKNVTNKYKSKYLDKNNRNKKLETKKSKSFVDDKGLINIEKIIDDNKNNEYNVKNKNKDTEIKNSKILNKNNNQKSIIPEEKFRFIIRGRNIIDSENENESDEEKNEESFLINPETKFVFIYDILITFITLYYLIYAPMELIRNFCFCTSYNKITNVFINSIFDIIFIIDIIVEFFRGFYTREEEKLVKNNIRIINNYITGWFLFDLLTALPNGVLFSYFCKKTPNKICFSFDNNKLMDFLFLIRCLKSLKIIKITTRKKNQFITKVLDKCSDYVILDLLSKIIFIYFAFHILSCIHIFIGNHIYPGWIFKNDFQNYSLLNIYVISIYYLITTMTTVGYGEIQSDSLIEIIFRIILLAVGIICYSWLISNISNKINKQSYASINFSNECLLLESIRRAHRELPYEVYSEIKNYLEFKHFKQKNIDKDFLINSLPYSLKNNLIFSMYKYQIEKFLFFKGISNTNFLVETLSYLIPVLGKKNDTFIKENEIVEEMYFVQEGKLALEVPINLDNLEESVNRYLSEEFLSFAFDFDFEANYNQLPNISQFETSNNMDDEKFNLGGLKHTAFARSFVLKNIEGKQKKKSQNNIYLKIHDIHKNEDFGDIYMFFGKRTPFALIGKSNKIQLYSIKKDNYVNLCEEYHNVFRRIHKKKKHNYKTIKNILLKTISKFCDIKGIKIKQKYRMNINKALIDMQKELIPKDILKYFPKNDLNDIDKQINNTLKDFEKEMNLKKRDIKKAKKKKIFENFLKNHRTMDETYSYNKKRRSFFNNEKKHLFLEDSSNIKNNIKNDRRHFNSISGNTLFNFGKNKNQKLLISKKKKKIRMKTKSNIESNLNLKGYNFDNTDDDSVKTEKISDNDCESFESKPKTMKILPNSLKEKLKTKINNKKILNKNNTSNEKEKTIVEKAINNNKNLSINISNKNIKLKVKNNNKKNNFNYNQKEMSSSCLSHDKLISKNNKVEKKLKNINNKKDNNKKSKKNLINTNKKLSNSKKLNLKNTISPRESIDSRNNNEQNMISYNQFNNYDKCSITNNNILLRLDENILNKRKNFDIENLSTDCIESFQINSSYVNLNSITDGAFIKEKKFQIDTIQFVKDYKNKNNKNKIIKKDKKSDSNSSFEFERGKTKKSIGNPFSINNNIKLVKRKMTQYLNKQIKYMKKKTLNSRIKRKNNNNKIIPNEKSKKDLPINNSNNTSNNTFRKYNNCKINLSSNEEDIDKDNNNELEIKIVGSFQ